MPGSIPNPIFYFPAKVAIYALAGWGLNKVYREGPNPLLFGVLRVVIGFGIGFLMLFAIEPMTPISDATSSRYSDYLWLAITRLLVWAGMILVFLREEKRLAITLLYRSLIGNPFVVWHRRSFCMDR